MTTKVMSIWQKIGIAFLFPIFVAAELGMLACGLWMAYAFIMIITGNAPK